MRPCTDSDSRTTTSTATSRPFRAARALNKAKVAERQADEVARLERFVARFRYGTKARQAQSKLKQLARVEAVRVEAPREGRRTLGFEFLKPARSGRMVLEAEGLDLVAGDKPLLADTSLALERGEHVALIGPNGSGKSTLLETIVGHREPDDGRLRTGHGVQVAYFSQHEEELDERGTVLECAMGATGLQRPQAQALLGRFLFSGWDEHEKPVVALSGGERRRLALALVVASGANFLVLDEPTNHLDLESREALEAALEAFPGTVLLVTHDRALLDAVAERIVEIEDGGLRSFPGGWADLVRRREEERVAAVAAEAPPPPPKPKPKAARPAKPRPSELQRVEASIEAAEARVVELERKLADDWTNMDTLTAHRAARDELTTLLARWEELFEAAQA